MGSATCTDLSGRKMNVSGLNYYTGCRIVSANLAFYRRGDCLGDADYEDALYTAHNSCRVLVFVPSPLEFASSPEAT